MKRFAALYEQLDQTQRSKEKIQALVRFFEESSPEDALWLVALLMGKRRRRPVKSSLLRQWAAEEAQLPPWLFEASYQVAGDLAETMALVLPPAQGHKDQGLAQWMKELAELQTLPEEQKEAWIKATWRQLEAMERFAFNKLLTGGFRVGVSAKSAIKAIALHLDKPEDEISLRLAGNWTPEAHSWALLLESDSDQGLKGRPYPFCLAYGLEEAPEALGAAEDWQVEWKWDGIRGQIIVRDREVYVWSRGEELVSHQFPEFGLWKDALPEGTVLDGEIVAWEKEEVGPFHQLQHRLGRKKPGQKLMKEYPVRFIAYDVLEWQGKDLRGQALAERRKVLEALVQEGPPGLLASEVLPIKDWKEAMALRDTARERKAEGLMLKSKQSPYRVGRKKGDWWKWKLDPRSIDAVLIYAQRGHGRRANLYTDFTFAVWRGEELVPFAKAYSGLTDEEMKQVDAFVKKHSLESFGPVRRVEPLLVFEIGFEGIQPSSRHKSGVSVRFPRMLRWRQDKKAEDANRLEDLMGFLE